MTVGEQLDPHHCGPGSKRFCKRKAVRRARRLGKKLMQDAPRKYYYSGYVS